MKTSFINEHIADIECPGGLSREQLQKIKELYDNDIMGIFDK